MISVLEIELLESDTPVHARAAPWEPSCGSLWCCTGARLRMVCARQPQWALARTPIRHRGKHESRVVATRTFRNLDGHSAGFCGGSRGEPALETSRQATRLQSTQHYTLQIMRIQYTLHVHIYLIHYTVYTVHTTLVTCSTVHWTSCHVKYM